MNEDNGQNIQKPTIGKITLTPSIHTLDTDRTIQNQETAGLCEQTCCLCCTHHVDLTTFVLASIIHRHHKSVFILRIIISLATDIIIPWLITGLLGLFNWRILLSQSIFQSLMVWICCVSLMRETSSNYSKISLNISSPLICIFKIFLRCSNNLFCREDQLNAQSYLSHRPLHSLFAAHVLKSTIIINGFVSFIITMAITFKTMTTKKQYLFILCIYFVDLLRSAYQAIVAENNYNARANRYADNYFHRQLSVDERQADDIEESGKIHNYSPKNNRETTKQNEINIQQMDQESQKQQKPLQKQPSLNSQQQKKKIYQFQLEKNDIIHTEIVHHVDELSCHIGEDTPSGNSANKKITNGNNREQIRSFGQSPSGENQQGNGQNNFRLDPLQNKDKQGGGEEEEEEFKLISGITNGNAMRKDSQQILNQKQEEQISQRTSFRQFKCIDAEIFQDSTKNKYSGQYIGRSQVGLRERNNQNRTRPMRSSSAEQESSQSHHAIQLNGQQRSKEAEEN